eukprot:TRINITY_DN3749_c0_g1_i1.p1 TRINITY_DN3749_c0_g1~~TRINITY_DN3749_c0_g1_i1.p1  ORF type:complete len:334 (-),score=64.72 TRINITY_DN3749_c0_g1_i1:93-1094(-)
MSSSSSSISSSSTTPLSLYSPFTERVSEILRKAAPLFVLLGHVINVCSPFVHKAINISLQVWEKLQPYHPEEFLPLITGLVIAFFGGHYFTLFAAIEAYRLCGWEQTKDCLMELYKNYLVVYAENEKDNQVDDNNDGIPDVQQIGQQELMTRKISLILKSLDPPKVTSALSGIWMGFLGVVAVLRLKFAQTIALGATIGGIFENVARPILTPILERTIPETHQKWNPVIISYACKSAGVSIAWLIQRVISAFYSSIKGAQMFSKGLALFFSRMGLVAWQEGTVGYFVVVGMVAWTGFAWQLQSGFSLPFPLNVILFPFTVLEWFVTWMVAVEQ